MSSTNWIQLIKKIAKEEREASKPCTIVVGMVITSNPIVITIGQKIMLSNQFLIIPDRVRTLIREGESVLLIRQEGGQKYAILDVL